MVQHGRFTEGPQEDHDLSVRAQDTQTNFTRRGVGQALVGARQAVDLQFGHYNSKDTHNSLSCY